MISFVFKTSSSVRCYCITSEAVDMREVNLQCETVQNFKVNRDPRKKYIVVWHNQTSLVHLTMFHCLPWSVCILSVKTVGWRRDYGWDRKPGFHRIVSLPMQHGTLLSCQFHKKRQLCTYNATNPAI